MRESSRRTSSPPRRGIYSGCELVCPQSEPLVRQSRLTLWEDRRQTVTITVEHVLPQNPKTGSQWMADFTGAQRGLWTHRLANLVLLNRAKNAEAQNYDFPTKKTKYFASKNGVAPFPITIQVVNQPEWTPSVLAARQDDLVGRLRAEWRLNVM